MSLSQAFKKGRTAFMPYICCGDPDGDFTRQLASTFARAGADALEFGIPFSDPIADGRAIQSASQRALSGGMTPARALGILKQIRKDGVRMPIAVMTYYNILYSPGLKKMLARIKEAGADGLIVPDVPLGESAPLLSACKKAGLKLIFLVTPNCSASRLKKIASKSSGFIYAVSVLGTTGARKQVSPQAISLVKRAKRITSLPIAVGFGVSTPLHAREFSKAGADGVIVGSEIVNIYSKHFSGGKLRKKAALAEISRFAAGMVDACRK